MKKSYGAFLALAVSVALIALSTTAAEPPKGKSSAESKTPSQAEETAQTTPDAPTVGAAARIWRDPQTGRLTSRRPEGVGLPALTGEERAAMRRDSQGLVVRSLPNGAQAIDLSNRFHNFAVVRIEDGKLESSCMTSAETAEEHLAHQPKVSQEPKGATNER